MESNNQELKKLKNKHKCDTCLKSFSNKFTLSRHIKNIHLGIHNFICSCSKSFATKEQLIRHQIIKHPTNHYIFCSTGCGQSFETNENRITHQELTHAEDKYFCPIVNCNRKFKSIQSIKDHLRYPHERNSSLSWKKHGIYLAIRNELDTLKVLKQRYDPDGQIYGKTR